MKFYAEEFLSSYLCSYWKGLSTKQALFSLIVRLLRGKINEFV